MLERPLPRAALLRVNSSPGLFPRNPLPRGCALLNFLPAPPQRRQHFPTDFSREGALSRAAGKGAVGILPPAGERSPLPKPEAGTSPPTTWGGGLILLSGDWPGWERSKPQAGCRGTSHPAMLRDPPGHAGGHPSLQAGGRGSKPPPSTPASLGPGVGSSPSSSFPPPATNRQPPAPPRPFPRQTPKPAAGFAGGSSRGRGGGGGSRGGR